MTDKRSSIANILYSIVDTTEIGGTTFNIYGSILKTLEAVRKHSWAELHGAYVALTGDIRIGATQLEMVSAEDVEAVVCGAVQIVWAERTGRESILPPLQRNQETRVTLAKSRSREHFLSEKQRAKKQPKGAKKMDEPQEGQEATGSTEGGETTATAPEGNGEATGGDKKPKVFVRGVTGFVSKKLDEGVTEIETLVELAAASFPECKNVRRHIQYVARERGITLTNRL